MSHTPDQARMAVNIDRVLADILEHGVPLTDRDGAAVLDKEGKPIMRPPPAAYIQAAIKRVGQLGIATDPRVPGTPAADLKEKFEQVRQRLRLTGTDGGLPPLSDEDDEATA